MVDDVSRIGRNKKEVLKIFKYLHENNINIFFKKEGLDLFNDGVLKLKPFLYSSEIERENIIYRLNSGRKLAIENGVKMGRKVGSTMSKNDKIEKYAAVIKKLQNGEKMTDIAAWCKGKGIKCSIATIKRLKKDIKMGII